MSMSLVKSEARTRVALWIAFAAFLLLSLLLDSAVAVPLRVPGHRALPGALLLMVAMELFVPAAAVALALATGVLVMLVAQGQNAGIWIPMGWGLTAMVATLAHRTRWRSTLAAAVMLGMLFGLLRSLGGAGGVQGWRIAAHAMFGGLGAVLGWKLVRWSSTR